MHVTPEVVVGFAGVQGQGTPRWFVNSVRVSLLLIATGLLLAKAASTWFWIVCWLAFAALLLAGAAIALLGRTSCSVGNGRFQFRPFGIFVATQTYLLTDIVAARVMLGPILELELASGVRQRFGPWTELTSFKKWDTREQKCQTLADAINKAIK